MMRLSLKLVLLLSLVGLLPAGGVEPAANSNTTPGDVLVFLGAIREETMLRFHYIMPRDGVMVGINVGVPDYTYFARVGERVASDTRKTNYRISKFEQVYKEVLEQGRKESRDVSRLTLVRVDDGVEIVLTYNAKYSDQRLKAKLRNRLTDQVMTVVKSEELKLDDQTYKVVEIKEDGVVLMDSLKREFDIKSPKKRGE